MSHRPRKRFGQNFLQDELVIQHILQVFNPQTSDQVIEIGPGLGALTQPLLQLMPKLTAIEIDYDLHEHLLSLTKPPQLLNLIKADALSIDFKKLGSSLRIIGNLPYNISTPLIFHLLNSSSHIKDMLFMLQKEVVERLAARPGCKAYGRLSVMVQYHCAVEHLFNVPPTAFYPPPKVESAIVSLRPYQASPYSEVEPDTLSRVVACAFAMRRKTIANNLKPLLNACDLQALGIEPGLRPEQIGIQDYVQLAKFISK